MTIIFSHSALSPSLCAAHSSTNVQTLTATRLQSWQPLPQCDMVAGPKVLAAGPTPDRFIREQTNRECLVIV